MCLSMYVVTIYLFFSLQTFNCINQMILDEILIIVLLFWNFIDSGWQSIKEKERDQIREV